MQLGFFFDAIGLVFDIIGLAFDIADAASKEGNAQATDLTKVYERLDDIERSIESSRAENQARFNELQNELNRQGMDATIRQFQSIQNNGDEGMRAWLVIHQCRINQARRQSTCPDLGGVQRPVTDSILRARSTLLNIVDVRWRDVDLPTLAGAYNGSGAGRGLAEAAWNYLRTQQNNRAGVAAESPIRSSEKMPVITPQLSQDMNAILGYYGGLIARYQFLRQVAVLEKDPTQNGCQWYEHIAEFFRANVCQRRLIEQMDDESSRWIYGSNPSSVNAAAARYKMPVVPYGAVAVAGIGRSITVPNGIEVTGDRARRIMYATAANAPGTSRPQSPYDIRMIAGREGGNDIRNLLAALQMYSGTRSFIRGFPASFQRVSPSAINEPISVSYVEFNRWAVDASRQIMEVTYNQQGSLSEVPLYLIDNPGNRRISPNWVAADPREAGTDYPMWGW